MGSNDLDRIEWHDLPLVAVTVTAVGAQLVFSVYNEATHTHVGYGLRLSHAASLSFAIAGEVSQADLANLEISTFSYTLSPEGLLTGTIGILVGNAGFWEISTTDARWELAEA